MPPKRGVCTDCRCYAEGAADPINGEWYCNPCWQQFNTGTTNKVPNSANTGGSGASRTPAAPTAKGKDAQVPNAGSFYSQDAASATAAAGVKSSNTNTNNKRNNYSGGPRQGNRGPKAGAMTAQVVQSAARAARQRMRDMLASAAPRSCHSTNSSTNGNNGSSSSLVEEFRAGHLAGSESAVGLALKPQRSAAVCAHSGHPLSPRAGAAHGGHLRDRKVPLDMLLSSVDDIVSQVYVCFDEDMTKLILNGLNRVTLTHTRSEKERVTMEVMAELLETLGDAHYDLLQCVLHNPRDVFLRLLEEFCTLEDDDSDANAEKGGGGGPKGVSSVRFINEAGPRKERMVFAHNGELANERWLAEMNRRYRSLTKDSELDKMMRRDINVTGSSIPKGATITDNETHIRVHIPPPVPQVLPVDKRVCVATTLPEWTHPAFGSITHLNTIQTEIFQTAFHTSQNILVCAPTGAGKTVCALLVMLRCISEHFVNGVLDRDFKIIYVAPMKALAQEMVTNFAKRLAPFMIKVRELTGDMQLTKREIAETQVIVTTPEKWDVITRKQTNEDLVGKVRLLIMDEIHLLNEDRGPVLEAIVARTLRQGEMDADRHVRLAGLSATLPNYKDVAKFLQVNLKEGLKVFGSEYRPVPLEQTFISVRPPKSTADRAAATAALTGGGKASGAAPAMSAHAIKEMMLDRLTYAEVVRNVREGHQVMVFVHSRKQTVEVAKYFMSQAERKGEVELFRGREGSVPAAAAKKGATLKGRDLSKLFAAGFGAHNAGMIRYDRSATEDLFRDGYIKVLCCTSTLAWGVNLPAHTVVIRGTQFYDPKKGAPTSISVLDVMQIFGRAGRPQYDTSGHGIIISDEKEIQHFLRLIASALPIESQLQNGLCDHLNAEVNGGTVSSVVEASAWLEYTYLWQRIRVNPLIYGLKINDVRKDPELKNHRYEMLNNAFTELALAGMVRYNPEIGSVEATDLGRLASHYYLSTQTIAVFNERMRKPDGTWIEFLDRGSALNIAACASEFSQLRVRREELDELQRLHESLPTVVREYRLTGESTDETSVQWKVTTLVKAYVCCLGVEEHSLSADLNYIAQNMPRILRALFEIELGRGHPMTTYTFLTLCKCMEHRCWDFEHPLVQFRSWSHRAGFTDAVWRHLAERKPTMATLQEMDAKEIGHLVHNVRVGGSIAKLVANFPTFELDVDVQPITRSILRVKVTISADFQWSKEISGAVEPFWLLVEDQGNHFIFHHEQVTITRKDVESGTPHVVNLAVPIVPQYDMYSVRLYSDRWLGCSDDYTFSIGHLHLPEDTQLTTKLLPLEPLRRHVIPAKYHCLYEKYGQFNAVQTQIFHALYHTDESVFLGAPTGSGKTIAAEFAVLRVFEQYPGAKIVYIAPLKALVKERLRDWRERFRKVGRSVVELSGDATPDISALAQADVLCTTPEKWDGISRNWQVRSYVTSVRLVVFDEIHMLGTDRGPILEVIVSRMRYIGWNLGAPVRLVGLSTAVSNPSDLSSWLGVEKKWAIFNFDPSVRPVPMVVHIAGYHGKNYCPRMATMNKPTYNAICEKSPAQPVIVFVSSRRQTRLTAMALIGFLMVEGNTTKWVHMPASDIEQMTGQLDDPYVKHCLQFGVGIHHAGLLESDRAVVEEAFLSNKIQVLVATSTLAWGVNFPAHMVIVKGTEYFDAKTHGYIDFPITDVLQMIGRAGRPQFDTEGVAQVLCHEPKKGFYRKFLYDPFPVESSLHKQLHVHINAEIVSGTITNRQEAINYLTWTYLFRRISRNPSYYGLEDGSPRAVTVFLSTLVQDILAELESCGCVEPYDPDDPDSDPDAVRYTVLGKLCSYYYISHKTAQLFDTAIGPDSTWVELLRILCEADEFNELPVRHNEDKLNLDLARQVPLGINEANADSPHVKAFLLFQAHFARARLPITDYVTDQKSAMDNAIRVIQAMVDVASNNGHLHAALRCMGLLQCLVQGVWWNDCTLLQLPYATGEMVAVLQSELEGVRELCDVVNAPLATLMRMERVLQAHRAALGLDQLKINEIMAAVRGAPLLEVRLLLERLPKQQQPEQQQSDHDEEEMVKDDDDAVTFAITVELDRLSYPQKSVIAPRYGKTKDEQYWVVIGHEGTGELVAVKRVNRLFTHSSVTLKVDWDDDWVEGAGDRSGAELNVYVVCDSFVGMDQQYAFTLPNPNVS